MQGWVMCGPCFLGPQLIGQTGQQGLDKYLIMMNGIRLIQILPKEALDFLLSMAEFGRAEAGTRPQSSIFFPGWCVPLAVCPPHRALMPDWRHLCSQQAETAFALIPWVSNLLKRTISPYHSLRKSLTYSLWIVKLLLFKCLTQIVLNGIFFIITW